MICIMIRILRAGNTRIFMNASGKITKRAFPLLLIVVNNIFQYMPYTKLLLGDLKGSARRILEGFLEIAHDQW